MLFNCHPSIDLLIHRSMHLLKTPCGVTPPPTHCRAWHFMNRFGMWYFGGVCLSILWLILFDLVRFLLGHAFCVLEFREFAKLGSKGVATTSKYYAQIDVKSIKHRLWERSAAEVLETGGEKTVPSWDMGVIRGRFADVERHLRPTWCQMAA